MQKQTAFPPLAFSGCLICGAAVAKTTGSLSVFLRATNTTGHSCFLTVSYCQLVTVNNNKQQ